MLNVEATFVSLPSATARRLPVGSNPCQGLWHRPSGGAVPRSALIATHYSADMSEHFLATRMAARGYGFLGWNTRYRGAEDNFRLEHALIDLAAGVTWLRERGVETIVLLGNSGGGSLMAAYQSQAARPALVARGGNLPPELNTLPAGDLYISLNAHAGRPEYLTSLIDPSVTDESDPTSTDSSLDMFLLGNGPPYSADFVAQYRAAQAARNRKITAWVLQELARLRERGHTDRMFSVPRVWADLRFLDPSLDPSDRQPGVCYAGLPQTANRGAIGVARAVTLNTWLAMWSLEHSQCRAAPHLKNIEIPSLVVQSMHDVGVFPSDAHAIHDGLCASDKRLVFVPGTHFFDAPIGAYDACADVLAEWLREHHA